MRSVRVGRKEAGASGRIASAGGSANARRRPPKVPIAAAARAKAKASTTTEGCSDHSRYGKRKKSM